MTAMLGALTDVLARMDEELAALLAHGGVWLVVPLALALGLRHATDPDHLVAVGALAGTDASGPRAAMRLGAWWGAGHAATLLLLGIPLIAAGATPPAWLAAPAEKAIGLAIVLLALRALGHRHTRAAATPRSARAAAGIGVLHGLGGTGAVVLLFVASLGSAWLAALALAVFAPASMLSMALCSGAVGWTLARPGIAVRRTLVLPVAASAGVAFGVWYALPAG